MKNEYISCIFLLLLLFFADCSLLQLAKEVVEMLRRRTIKKIRYLEEHLDKDFLHLMGFAEDYIERESLRRRARWLQAIP